MVLHFEDSLQSNGVLVLVDSLIGVGEHSDQQVKQQDEVDHDEDDQESLTLPFLELSEILLTIEGRKHGLNDSPKIKLINSKRLVHIVPNKHEHNQRNQKRSEELGQISPKTHHHYNGWTQSTGSSEHTQDVQRVLCNDHCDDVREMDHIWVDSSQAVCEVKNILLITCQSHNCTTCG